MSLLMGQLWQNLQTLVQPEHLQSENNPSHPLSTHIICSYRRYSKPNPMDQMTNAMAQTK